MLDTQRLNTFLLGEIFCLGTKLTPRAPRENFFSTPRPLQWSLVLLFIQLFGLVCVPTQSAEFTVQTARPTEITVVSWNLEWFPGRRRDPDSASVSAHVALARHELRQLNPDIFLAQEIRDWESFALLSEGLAGLRPAVISAFTAEDTGEYWPQQLAVGSKLPVIAAWSEPWKAREIHPRRGFAAAALDVGGGRLLLVYSVHLKSNRSSSEEETLLNFRTREESARQLLDHVRQMQEFVFKGRVVGVVIGGDFNTNKDGRFGDTTIQILEKGGFHNCWEGVPLEKRLTWRQNQFHESTTFDHFFTKGLGTPRAEMVETAPAASDHYAIRLRIALPD